jgi:tellurite resistance protein TerC
MGESIYFWIGFITFVIVILSLDLGVFHRKDRKVPVREAIMWTAIWVSMALIFCLIIYLENGPGEGKVKALEFLTGYVIEYSLSIDNIFVFILIFSFFSVSEEYQHKVLFWGIIGAVFMRAIFIFTGVTLINRFHWIIFIFGGFLIITGIRMLFKTDIKVNPDRNPVVRFSRKIFPVTDVMHGGKFFIRKDKSRFATPLFLVLLIIESSDVIFAVDSIPAILAITRDSFIVFTSNIFAIMGLRSLYFAISGIMEYFRYLKKGLAFILAFVGIKMCISDFLKIPVFYSLFILASLIGKRDPGKPKK